MLARLAASLLLPVFSSASYLPKDRPYHVEDYAIDVHLDVESGRFDNTVDIRLVPSKPIREIELDSQGLEIHEVRERKGSSALSFKTDPRKATLAVNAGRELEPGKSFELEIRYSGRAGSEPEGLARAVDPRDPKRLPTYFTQFESIAARRFFPCDDEPFDKARTQLSAELDARYLALSNGRLVEDRVEQGRRHVRWMLDKPQSTYLVTFVAGQFDTLAGTADGVPITIYIGPGRKEDARLSLQVLEKIMPFFDRYFGVRYPWSSYGMVGVPGFYWEGMENTTLTTIVDSEVALDDPSSRLQEFKIEATVSHELAHHWFGDWVTMKWWDDVWLNEAFASFMETEAGREYFGNDAALISAVAQESWGLYFQEEEGPKSHPIVSEDLPSPEDAFDWTNYIKGRHVLWMLRYYVGDRAFRKGVRDYLVRNAYGNATYRDFFAAIEKASGQDLSRFVDCWLKKRGYPVLQVRQDWDASQKTLALQIAQTPVHPKDDVVFDFKIPVAFHRRTPPAYDREVSMWIQASRTDAKFELPAEPEWVSWNPGAPALVRVERDVPDEQRRRQALEDPDPIARLSALLELVQPWMSSDAKEPRPLSDATLDCLRKSLLGDPSPYVRAQLLKKLESSKGQRLPPQLGDTVLALAQEPSGLAASDELGRLTVRSASIALLGKAGSAGRGYVERMLSDPAAGLDLVSAAASGEAMFSDARALEKLKSALSLQGARGFAFRRAIRVAFASVENVATLPELDAILAGGENNDELYLSVLERLEENEAVKNSKQGAQWLAALALNDSVGEGVQAQVLEVFDDADDPAVKPSIERIARESKSDRIRQLALEILRSNFK